MNTIYTKPITLYIKQKFISRTYVQGRWMVNKLKEHGHDFGQIWLINQKIECQLWGYKKDTELKILCYVNKAPAMFFVYIGLI